MLNKCSLFFPKMNQSNVYVLKRNNLLSTLLSLEFMVLFSLLFMIYLEYNFEYYFSMSFLVFSACEGALSLSVLVSVIRTDGNINFLASNI